MWALCGNQKVDAKRGNKMCKLNGRCIREGIMTCKCKSGCNRGHYDVQIKRVDGKGWALLWKSKGGCKRGYYDVRIKRAD